MKRLVARLAELALAMIVLAGPPASAETPAAKVYRVAVLSASVRSADLTRNITLPDLAKEGFVEGRNLTLDARFGPTDRLPALMREILAAKPDLVLAVGWEAIRAARLATSSVPIVIFGPDPVRLGLADSLSRPGGNVTGVVILATELDSKRLELLHEAVPSARRIAALMRPSSPYRALGEREMGTVAKAAGFTFLPFYADGSADYPSVFAAMRKAGADGLAIAADPEFFRDTAELAQQARQAGLPTACQWSEMAELGCLLSYGPNLLELRRRLAHYIVRILNGAQPGTLPIEQPTKFELVVNLKTAKALGLTIPQTILLRTDTVIE